MSDDPNYTSETGTAAGDPSPSRPWRWLIVASIIYTVVICIIVALRAESSSDFRDFWRTALHFRQTGVISSELGVHNYLPIFTIAMVPWSFLPLQAAIVAFTILSLSLFAASVWLSERLLCETRPVGTNQSRDRKGAVAARQPQHEGNRFLTGAALNNRGAALLGGPRPALLAAVGLMLAYATSCAVVGQLGFVLLFLIVLALHLARQRQDYSAGALLALATLLKLVPAVLVVFFLLRGRWRIAASAAGVTAIVGLGVPLALLGWNETVEQHRTFYTDAVRGHSAHETIHADKPVKSNFSNNALPMVLRRLMSPINASKGRSEGVEWRVNLVHAPTNVIWGCYLAIMALLLGGSVWVALRGQNEVAAYAVWCCLMLLASPLVWTHYLPLAYLALAWLADHGARVRDTTGRSSWPVIAALTLWLLGVVMLAWEPARAAGAQIGSVMALWCALVWLSGRHAVGHERAST